MSSFNNLSIELMCGSSAVEVGVVGLEYGSATVDGMGLRYGSSRKGGLFSLFEVF